MNRRGFLGSLAAAISAATLDPEKLLWVPGKKTIFVPPLNVNPTLDELNQITLKYITPGLLDTLFRPDLFTEYLRKSESRFRADTGLYERITYGR